MAGRKKSGTWKFVRHTGSKAIDPVNYSREEARAEAHNQQEMWRLAVAFRLEEYAQDRMLTKMMDSLPEHKAWLKKVRISQKHNVALLPQTLCVAFDQKLIDFGLPPLQVNSSKT